MKKAILTCGLFSMMMILTSFTQVDIKKQTLDTRPFEQYDLGGTEKPKPTLPVYDLGGTEKPKPTLPISDLGGTEKPKPTLP